MEGADRSQRRYDRLFGANVLALLSTGVASVALTLLVFEIAPDEAGIVLASALSIKMAGFILGPPLVAAFARRMPRLVMIAALNIMRALALLGMPLAGSVGTLYALAAVIALTSAALGAIYQESVALLLTGEAEYTWALAKSRAAYDMEAAAGALFAAVLLLFVSDFGLFVAAVALLVVSTVLTLSVDVPAVRKSASGTILDVATRGVRTIATAPQLRGVPYLAVAVASAAAMVGVNTVVLVQGELGRGEEATAVALGAFGIGSVVGAFLVPRLLARRADRHLMLGGTALSTAALILAAFATTYPILLAMWAAIGVGASVAQLPASFAVRRVARPEDYATMFAGLMAITYAAYMVAYQIAGRVGAAAGMDAAFVLLSGIAVIFAAIASWHWSVEDPNPQMAAR